MAQMRGGSGFKVAARECVKRVHEIQTTETDAEGLKQQQHNNRKRAQEGSA
jgi:hypothetical protein